MSSSGGTDGGTASLFPDSEAAVRKAGVDLRKAGSLLAVPSEPRNLEDTSSATDQRTGDLFAWGARQNRVNLSGLASSSSRAGARQRTVLQGPAKRRAGRLMRCLDGGDRGGSDNPSRRVRRNRALFLVLLAALTLFVIARLLFHG